MRDRFARSEERDQVEEALTKVLKAGPPKALAVRVATDSHCKPEQYVKLAKYLSNARLLTSRLEDGYDGF